MFDQPELDIGPATHTIIYRPTGLACPNAPTRQGQFYWHLAIMNSDGEIEVSKENQLWEHAEMQMIKWHDAFSLSIYEATD